MRRTILVPLTLATALSAAACQQGSLSVDPGGNAGGSPDLSEHGEDFEKVGTSDGEIDPARVTLRRLNRTEYNNTVRDLLGTQLTPADTFPEDDFGYGFNTIGDVLSLSPTHLEAYQIAAEELVADALATGAASDGEANGRVEAETLTGTSGSASGDAWALSSNGQVGSVVQVDGGEHVVENEDLRAAGDGATDGSALALPAGESDAALAEYGLVAFREVDDIVF